MLGVPEKEKKKKHILTLVSAFFGEVLKPHQFLCVISTSVISFLTSLGPTPTHTSVAPAAKLSVHQKQGLPAQV